KDRYGGISFVLCKLDTPGVTVRPLRQITGESEFGEVFFEDARVPKENLVGKIGAGFRIAMTVLAYERGASALAYSQRFARDLRLLACALEVRGRLTGSAGEKVARLVVENEVMRANGVRMLATFAEGKAPGTESSLEKIFWSEFDQRFRETAIDLLGPGGQLLRSSPGARPDVDWAREFLWSRAATIYSGSSEVQRNIVLKRVLGLPQPLSDALGAVRRPAAAAQLHPRLLHQGRTARAEPAHHGAGRPRLRSAAVAAARRDGLRRPRRPGRSRGPGARRGR